MSKRLYGSKEWTTVSKNFITGCSNDCRYCYSKAYSIGGGYSTSENWKEERVRDYKLKERCGKIEGRIMVPSSHDISLEHLEESIAFLKKLLDAGNEVLVVSKPHLECVSRICNEFEEFKDKILFRFTIGSSDSDVLSFWEPGAPDFAERFESLKLACDRGFQTSVSCEPMLDDNIDVVIEQVMPFVSDAIWIGKANYLLDRLEINGYDDEEILGRAQELIAWQSDDNIKRLYERYKDNGKIKWKESIKKIVGIKIPKKKGLDI